jgi:tetratricopeptide (TPR) repeat protein
MSPMPNDDPAAHLERDLVWTRTAVLTLVIAGALGIWFIAIAGPSQFARTMGTGILVGAAAFGVGGVLGFLFGIPRGPSGSTPSATPSSTAFQHNTNLEQISDWLTKALVGAGLTQLQAIWGGLRSGGHMVADSLHGTLSEPSALALMILNGVAGFLAGYLFTALFLGGAFARAARASGQIPQAARLALEAYKPQVEENRPAGGLSPQADQAAAKVREIGLDQLRTPEDLTTWAKAQVAAGRYDAAADAYRRALRDRPNDPTLHREYAVALASTGDFTGAIRELQSAQQRASTTTPARERANIALDLIFNYLYVDSPDGPREALRLIAQYQQDGLDVRDPRLWIYKASALGQLFSWEKERRPPEDPLLAQLRTDTLQAIREAIRLDPISRAMLRSLWDGPNREENDLAVFQDDDEFRQVLTQ